MEIGQHSNSLQKSRGLGLLGVADFVTIFFFPSSASLEKGPKSRMHQNTKEGTGRKWWETVEILWNMGGGKEGQRVGRVGEGRIGKNRGET